MLAQRHVQRRAQRGGGSIGRAGEALGELLGDRRGEGIADHLHVMIRRAGRRIGLRPVAGGLRVDDVFQGENVAFDQISHRALRQIGVGRAEKRAEVLAVAD